MLAIRLQRTGRKGHAQYRVIVQDAHRSPKSGKIVAQVGHYNPHSKATVIDKEKVSFYLNNGAQPSDRIVKMLVSEGVTLPSWVKSATIKERKIRNTEKLRRNRSTEPVEANENIEEVTADAAEEVAKVVEEQPSATEPSEENSSEKTQPSADTESDSETAATTEVAAEETVKADEKTA
ncbi:MAG: 30S ribosomal protein S16 [Patescibacteria group bacterium]